MRTGIFELRLKADPRDVNEVLGLGEGGDAPAGGLLLLGGGISQRSVRPSSLAILLRSVFKLMKLGRLDHCEGGFLEGMMGTDMILTISSS